MNSTFTSGWNFVLIVVITKGRKMASQGYLTEKNRYVRKSTNINDLLNKAKFERQKEKRNTYIVTTASVSVLAIFALIILL